MFEEVKNLINIPAPERAVMVITDRKEGTEKYTKFEEHIQQCAVEARVSYMDKKNARWSTLSAWCESAHTGVILMPWAYGRG